jgi:hypothetical protein
MKNVLFQILNKANILRHICDKKVSYNYENTWYVYHTHAIRFAKKWDMYLYILSLKMHGYLDN